MEDEKEKVTMKESEIEALVAEKTETALREKMDGILEDVKSTLGEYTKDALAEQMKDTLKKVEAETAKDEELEAAKKEAEKDWKNVPFGDFLTAIRKFRKNGEIDNRLTFVKDTGEITKTAGHMEISTDAQGGFLVPEVYRADLQKIALENAVVRPNGATVIGPLKTDSLKIPTVQDTSHSSTVFGGVQAKWTAERGTKSATKPSFGQLEITPHKLAGITYTSNELLDDSAIALAPLIRSMFGSAWGWFEDDAFINGTGAGQPMGFLTSNALRPPYRNTVNRVVWEDLREMYANMLPSSHASAIWICNNSVLPDLIGMQTGDAAPGTGANVININPNMGGADKVPMRIFGRPLFVSEKLPALGSQGDICYVDLKYYIIFDRQPITIDVSTHVAFTTDETCWRFVLRVGGQCWPQSAITLKNSAAPVTAISPFVALAATTS